jgi:hypothetical protein
MGDGMPRKRKRGKSIWILSFTLIAVAIIIFSALTYKPPKKDIKDYFQISDAVVVGMFEDEENDTLTVLTLSFNLTAIGGSASYGWVIPKDGNVPSQYWERFNLAKGETDRISIFYGGAVKLPRTDNGIYPFHIEIDCYEAHGFIIVNATLPVP